MKAVIIDDESLARQIVQKHLANFPEIKVIATCADGFEGLKAIQEHQPELVFLDIQMPKITGFEMLELLEDKEKPYVIFTTAFDQFALKAFEINALDYLLKPFSKERFNQAIERFFQEKQKTELANKTLEMPSNAEELKRIVVKSGTAIKIIPIHEVLFFEAWDDYVKIHTTEGYFAKKKSMNFYETTLEPAGFVRIHRSFLVNAEHVHSIKPYTPDTYKVLLRNQQEIQASRNGYSKLKSTLGI